MKDHTPRTRIRVLTHDETRFWHSRFNRYYSEAQQTRIVEGCERDARRLGCAGYLIFDAYEMLVARGSVVVV